VHVSVSSQRDGDAVTVVVSGDVDLSAAPLVENAILDAVSADGVRRAEVDLSQVEFLDSSGISLLLRGRRQADERGVAYRVTGTHGIVQQVLEMTGVWDHLCVPDDSQPAAP
jgi:anti-sigma B factor antagonist